VKQLAETERAYRAALAQTDLSLDLRAKALRNLAYLLKRANRKDEAFAYWQQLALEATGSSPSDASSNDDTLAHVELAKYFEWDVGDLSLAAGWTRAALALAESWPTGLRRDDALDELHHRLERLERKAEKA
jgi:hypothetical protein